MLTINSCLTMASGYTRQQKVAAEETNDINIDAGLEEGIGLVDVHVCSESTSDNAIINQDDDLLARKTCYFPGEELENNRSANKSPNGEGIVSETSPGYDKPIAKNCGSKTDAYDRLAASGALADEERDRQTHLASQNEKSENASNRPNIERNSDSQDVTSSNESAKSTQRRHLTRPRDYARPTSISSRIINAYNRISGRAVYQDVPYAESGTSMEYRDLHIYESETVEEDGPAVISDRPLPSVPDTYEYASNVRASSNSACSRTNLVIMTVVLGVLLAGVVTTLIIRELKKGMF